MSINKLRSLLNGNDLKDFDNTLSKFSMCNNVKHAILDFKDAKNFILKSEYDVKPKTGLVIFENGQVASTLCC